MSNLINTGSKNISVNDLVEGKKYQLVLISGGQEYPQAQAFFRGFDGQDLKWEHTNPRTGSQETKTLPADGLVYRNMGGGSRRRGNRGSRGNRKSRRGSRDRKNSRKDSRKNKRNTMRR